MMAGQCPATFSSYSMTECDSAKKKYLHAHMSQSFGFIRQFMPGISWFFKMCKRELYGMRCYRAPTDLVLFSSNIEKYLEGYLSPPTEQERYYLSLSGLISLNSQQFPMKELLHECRWLPDTSLLPTLTYFQYSYLWSHPKLRLRNSLPVVLVTSSHTSLALR